MSLKVCVLSAGAAAMSAAMMGSIVGSAGAEAADAPVSFAGVSAAPMHSDGEKPVYPRLTAFPNPAIMQKVNAALAKQEADDRDARSSCIASVLESKQQPDADTYHADVRVTYLSPRYLSVNVVSSYYCGGPYPTNGAEAPVTFDLTTGDPIDWQAVFKPGFLPPADGEDSAHPSGLARIYKARYRKTDSSDDDCGGVINDPSWFFSPTLWLDAKAGLVVEPDFPHVVAACADELHLSPADLAPYVKAPAFLADVKATVRLTPHAKPKAAKGTVK